MKKFNPKDIEDIIVNYYYNNHSKDYIWGYLQACYTHHIIKFNDYKYLLDSMHRLFK